MVDKRKTHLLPLHVIASNTIFLIPIFVSLHCELSYPENGGTMGFSSLSLSITALLYIHNYTHTFFGTQIHIEFIIKLLLYNLYADIYENYYSDTGDSSERSI